MVEVGGWGLENEKECIVRSCRGSFRQAEEDARPMVDHAWNTDIQSDGYRVQNTYRVHTEDIQRTYEGTEGLHRR